ncbi:hypothetical protein ATY29_05955 [Rhizobium hidalgonense]|nr:hypothetical protein ATY29_05955 [Rhizobium hidalgonense]
MSRANRRVSIASDSNRRGKQEAPRHLFEESNIMGEIKHFFESRFSRSSEYPADRLRGKG